MGDERYQINVDFSTRICFLIFPKFLLLNVIHYFSEFVYIFGTLKDDQIQLNFWEKMNYSTKNAYRTAQCH